MISLIIAGGISLAASSSSTKWPDIDNHTLAAEVIPSSQVVTRNMWGTPMLPDGKGGYSLIAAINQNYINESLIIPPWNLPKGVTTQMVIYRPMPPTEEIAAPVDVVTPAVQVAPVEQAPVMDSTAPVDATLPAADTTAPADATAPLQ
ncbi:MAG: hypothetical protein ACREKL_12740 [Chthoniobacterales bacterium]